LTGDTPTAGAAGRGGKWQDRVVVETKRGRLIIFLGAAPAVGKTYASLQEAHQLVDHGVEVVVGLVETHGRASLIELLDGLVVMAPRQAFYRGRYFDELDLPTLLERHPQAVVVDELAHSNSPGLAHEKRWQDVEELLNAGIDVISNLNVQHLASLNDEVERITGLPQLETVPDELVVAAERIAFVRVSTTELRDRVSAGGIFDAKVVATTLAGFFSPDRLRALDALALRWLSEQGRPEAPGVEEAGGVVETTSIGGDRDLEESGLRSPPQRLVAFLSGAVEGDRLLRHAARLAKSTGSELVGLRVREPSDPRVAEPVWLQGQRRLLTELGGRYAEVGGEDVARAVLQFAETERATHLVLGATRRSRLYELAHGSVVNDVVRAVPAFEVHIVPTVATGARRHAGSESDDTLRLRPSRVTGDAPLRIPQWRRRRSELPTRRRALAYLLALVAPAAIARIRVPFRSTVGLPGTLLILLLGVILVAGVGGFGAAALATAVGILLADYFLTHPLHSFAMDRINEIFALIAFAVVATVVSILVNVLANESVVGARRRAVADGLARLAADCLVAAGSPAVLKTVDSLRRTLELDGVAVLRAVSREWSVEAAAGENIPRSPEEAASFVELGGGLVLVLAGDRAVAEESDLVRAFMSEIRLEQERIQLQRIRRLGEPGDTGA
jgi:two-component system sensor histidine kinase KdpD